MKKLLVALALSLMAASPAFAWPKTYTFVNNTIHWPPDLNIEKIVLSMPGHSHTFKITETGPGQWATFNFYKDPPCLWWVTLINEYRPNLTAPTQFNTCTQSKITIFQKSSAGDIGFTFN